MELAGCPSSRDSAIQPSYCCNLVTTEGYLAFRLDSSPAFGDSEGSGFAFLVWMNFMMLIVLNVLFVKLLRPHQPRCSMILTAAVTPF